MSLPYPLPQLRPNSHSFILWYVVTGLVFVIAAARYLLRRRVGTTPKGDVEAGAQRGHGAVYRGARAVVAWLRNKLLGRAYFGISGVQLTLLTMVIGYLTIFSSAPRYFLHTASG